MRQIIAIIFKTLFYLFRIFRIKKNKIVFVSYLGKGYGDNGKYIAEELLSRKKDLDIVWLCRDMNSEFPDGIRKVKYNSLRSVYELATARVWVDNKRKPIYVRKRAGQYYIMTWHADSVLKKVEKDAETKLPSYYVEAAKNDSKMADLFLSSCAWETRLYRNAFWYKGEIMEEGYPRQDILFNYDENTVNKIKAEIGISSNTKIVMYAPTFRKNMTSKDLDIYSIDWKKMLSEFEHRFGGKWVGMIRLHPNVAKLSGDISLPDSIQTIKSGAFSTCAQITSLWIPSSVTDICDEAFSYCSAIKKLHFEEGLNTIGYGAFMFDQNIETVSVPTTVQTIDEKAFAYCMKLNRLILPEGLKKVGTDAFLVCDELKQVSIPKSVTEIGDDAFGYTVENSQRQLLNGFKLSVFSGSAGEKYAKSEKIEHTVTDVNIKKIAFIAVSVGLIIVVIVFAFVLMKRGKKLATAGARKAEKERLEKEAEKNYKKIMPDDDQEKK